MSDIKVYKFGGASVSSADGVRNVCRIVKHQTNKIMLVVSAMGKTTNALEQVVEAVWKNNIQVADDKLEMVRQYHFQIANELFPSGHTFLQNQLDQIFEKILPLTEFQTLIGDYDCLYDQIVSIGELLSTKIVTHALDREGIPASLIDITRVFLTDSTYREAKVDQQASEQRLNALLSTRPSRVYVTQGFIGADANGYRTTLGREGSDYTAALLANMLDSESVSIFKDVPGVLNADPRLVTDTVLIPELTYSEAVELAYSGAQVIHPKTIRPLENKDIPLYVRPFMHPEQTGSIIKREVAAPINVPVYIWRQNQLLITLRPKDFSFVLEDSLQHLFSVVASHRLKVNLIQSSAVTVSVAVDNTRYVKNALEELSATYKVTYNEGLSLLTIRGATPQIIQREKQGRVVMLSQTTRRTARLLVVSTIDKA